MFESNSDQDCGRQSRTRQLAGLFTTSVRGPTPNRAARIIVLRWETATRMYDAHIALFCRTSCDIDTEREENVKHKEFQKIYEFCESTDFAKRRKALISSIWQIFLLAFTQFYNLLISFFSFLLRKMFVILNNLVSSPKRTSSKKMKSFSKLIRMQIARALVARQCVPISFMNNTHLTTACR